MPRVDEAEAIKIAAKRGIKLTPLPPDSHMVEGPAGRFVFENLSITDEGFSHRKFGTLNITKALSLIPKDMPPTAFPIDAGLLENVADIELEPSVLADMTEERLNEPVLFLADPEGYTYLIDGAHRLRARVERKMESILGFRFSPAVLPIIQVKAWKLDKRGKRTPYNLMEKILAHLP